MGSLIGFVRIADIATQKAIQRLLMPADELGEGALITIRGATGQGCIRGLIGAHGVWLVSDLTTVSSNRTVWSGLSTERIAMT